MLAPEGPSLSATQHLRAHTPTSNIRPRSACAYTHPPAPGKNCAPTTLTHLTHTQLPSPRPQYTGWQASRPSSGCRLYVCLHVHALLHTAPNSSHIQVLAIGFLLVILSAALFKNYLTLLVVATYAIAPIPNWICGRASNPDDFMESSGSGVIDFGRFLTGFFVVMGVGTYSLDP